MAADIKTLQDIHEKVAKSFLALLDGDDPIPPAVYGHIIKFLDNNHVEALAVPGGNLDKLKGKLHLIKDYLEPHEREAIGE